MLEVHARDETAVDEVRQHVVTVDALFDGRVDFEPVVEGEEARGPRSVPNEVIERREERAPERAELPNELARMPRP